MKVKTAIIQVITNFLPFYLHRGLYGNLLWTLVVISAESLASKLRRLLCEDINISEIYPNTRAGVGAK